MIDPIINAKLNKLLDAGGYSKTKNETILAEVVLAENPEAPGVTVYQGSDKLGLVVGKTYTVHLDSGSYKTVCKDFGGGLLLGNGAIVGSDSFASDESFAVGEMGADGQSMCIIVDANNGKTASVSAITETIVPIDQKYLPGVCLPVVEIADISAITAEEGAELGKHIGIPVVIKVTIDGTLNCCIFNYTYVDAYRMHLYGTTIGTDAVILTSNDGVSWAKG
jgi:hypothetical protein